MVKVSYSVSSYSRTPVLLELEYLWLDKLTTGRPHIRQEVKVALVQSKTCGASHSQSDKGKECSLIGHHWHCKNDNCLTRTI